MADYPQVEEGYYWVRFINYESSPTPFIAQYDNETWYFMGSDESLRNWEMLEVLERIPDFEIKS